MNQPSGSSGCPPKYLTPSEAAQVLRVDRRTVYTWLRTHKIKAVQLGRTWRIPESSVLPQ